MKIHTDVYQLNETVTADPFLLLFIGSPRGKK